MFTSISLCEFSTEETVAVEKSSVKTEELSCLVFGEDTEDSTGKEFPRINTLENLLLKFFLDKLTRNDKNDIT